MKEIFKTILYATPLALVELYFSIQGKEEVSKPRFISRLGGEKTQMQNTFRQVVRDC